MGYALALSITNPQEGSSYQSSPHTTGPTNIRNDALLCKVFPASLQGQALSWFHRLSMNSVDNFQDLSEAFVEQYMCSTRHKQNISTMQNIKLQENESLREFNLTAWTLSSKSLSGVSTRACLSSSPSLKSPLVTMDDLFKRANKYSMLKDDVCAATQQILVTSQPTKNDAVRNPKIVSQRRQVMINYIHGGPLDEEYNFKQKRQRLLRAASVREQVSFVRPGLTSGNTCPINGVITFPPVDSNRIFDFDVRRILVDPSSSTDLLQVSVIKQMGFSPSNMEKPGWILSGFNGASTTSLGNIVLPVQADPVTLNVQFSIVEDLSPFNAILGSTLLHGMKVIPSTYHQMVSYLTEDRQINLYDSQLPARQCYPTEIPQQPPQFTELGKEE
uniref:Retrotransposon gag domain-containing protein n=1 Tax=Vitis vinifera TaxID=29760 RepID=A5BDG4_VITVI|nr:hypothetical protein VITISV_041882 [Vitis vinifera]